MIRAAVRFLRAMPGALEALYLEWALREINPLHPDVPLIVRRLNELEEAK